MSILFSPSMIGNMEIKNRFIASSTFESMATEDGEPTEDMLKWYSKRAQGGTGLIFTGYMYVSPVGKSFKYQTGIYSDKLIPGLQRLADTVHEDGGKIVFQLAHTGRQTKRKTIGQAPVGPSHVHWDTTFMLRPKEMSEDEITGAIEDFGRAAKRAAEAGADGVQIHAAHGYLINEFLSPFFNQRNDGWGGSDEKRFRFLKEVIVEVKKALPENMPVMIKLNSNDFTPKTGMTPDLSTRYASWLPSLGVDAIEVSSGTVAFSMMNIWRGDVPTDDLVRVLPAWQKPVAKILFNNLKGKYNLDEGYNVNAASEIKRVVGNVPVITVGGLRNVGHMEEVLDNGSADFISMCRPLIKEPNLVNKFREGKSESAKCLSCNRCLAVVLDNKPVRCAAGDRI